MYYNDFEPEDWVYMFALVLAIVALWYVASASIPTS